MIKPAVNFLPNAVACYNFVEAEGDVATRKTVVLVPIKVTFDQGEVIIAWGCVPPATMIRTEDGYRGIENLKVGDEVLAYNDSRQLISREITKTFKRKYYGTMLRFKPARLPALRMTPEHPVLTRLYKKMSYHDNSKIEFSQPMWLPAKNAYKLYKFVPRNVRVCVAKPYFTDEIDIEELNENKLKLLAWYMAEGNYESEKKRLNGIGFTLSQKETEIAENLAQIIRDEFQGNPWTRNVTDSRTGFRYMRLRVKKVDLAKFVRKWCAGKKAKVKKFNEHILRLPQAKQRIILDEFCKGDGAITKRREKYYGTSSRKLSLQILEMLIRQNGLGSYSGTMHPSGGFRTKSSQFYQLIERNKKHLLHCEDSLMWTPIRSIEEVPYNGYVYNLAIEKDENYITDSILVHNCSLSTFCKDPACLYSTLKHRHEKDWEEEPHYG